MNKYVIIGIVVLLGVVLLGLALPGCSHVWDGSASVAINLEIVDEENSRPVQGANVWIIRSSQLAMLPEQKARELYIPGVSDERGKARVGILCGAGGSRFFGKRVGRFVISHELTIEADGYRPLSTPLVNIVGKKEWKFGRRSFDLKVHLLKRASQAP